MYDWNDAFPLDPNEDTDTDADGIGNNADADDDGDGVIDSDDAFPLDPNEDTDTDGDGYGDNGDVFPNDSSEWYDTDGDGVGDNGDAFPNDPSETADTDGDGVGDNSDLNPSGNAYVYFELTDLFADTSADYDFMSAPDMYVQTYFDEDCDGTFESSGSTPVYTDSYNPYLGSQSARTVAFDIDDDATSFCYQVRIYDQDSASDDLLDYVTGTGSYYTFTANGLTSSYFNSISYYGSGEYKPVGFDMDVYIG